MAKIIGYDETKRNRFTCYHCAAIVEYMPNEVHKTDRTDEGVPIKGLNCPGCGTFHRTNT